MDKLIHITSSFYYLESGQNYQVATPVKGWTADRNPSFVVNVGFNDSRLIIQESGLYYVYSQLTMIEYRQSTSGRDGPPRTSIVHHIERWNVIYPDSGVERLLRHSESRAQTMRSPFTEYVTYVGGVVPLRAGDEIYVTVSDIDLVQSEAKSTYFGMYRI